MLLKCHRLSVDFRLFGNVHSVALPLVADDPKSVLVGQRVEAVSTWSSVEVPVMITVPLGASLTLATALVAAEFTDSAVPWLSV